MTVTEPDTDAALEAVTQREIARVRRLGGLGESGRLRELFDFLVARAGDANPPKEVEIAVTVFGKPEAETLKDDPVARVYVHRLRKRLDEFYRREGAPEGVRLDVPKGQYRVVGVRADAARDGEPRAAAAPGGEAPARAPRRRTMAAIGAAAALLLLNVAAWAVFASPRTGHEPGHPVWSAMDDAARPTVIVVGDYYMFGERDGPFLRRLVRDFDVNSREELLQRRMEDDSAYARYTDVNLQYLPVSVAFALSQLMPAAPHDKPVRVMLASDVTPDTVKDNDIVYIGLLSGLGMLRDPVFARSRFAIGESYDELIDLETGEAYVSEGFVPETYDGMYRDYGFFSSFEGPSGNRIVVVAGERDAAVTGVAELLGRADTLQTLSEAAGGADSFEALWEVEGQQNVSLDARLVLASALDSQEIWTAENMAP